MDIQDITIAFLASGVVGAVYGVLVALISARPSDEREVWLAYLNAALIVGIFMSLQTTIARHLGLMLLLPALIGIGLGFILRLICQPAKNTHSTNGSKDTVVQNMP